MENNKTINYDEVFSKAKESTVYAHALVFVEKALENKNESEAAQFLEIERIISEARKHL